MAKTSNSSSYRERVFPGFSFYLATLFAPGALYLIVLAFDDFWALFTFVASELAIIAISLVASPTIELSKEQLSIGRVKLPTEFISSITTVEPSDQLSEKGPKLHPAAYLRFQVGINGLVKIQLSDPTDPTPYWLISTRHPTLIASRFRDLAN